MSSVRLCTCVPTHEGARIGAWGKKLDRSRTRGATVSVFPPLFLSRFLSCGLVFRAETKKEPGLDDDDEKEEKVKGTHTDTQTEREGRRVGVHLLNLPPLPRAAPAR